MTFHLFSRVTLAVDLPEHGLRNGGLVTIVEYLPANDRRATAILLK